MCVLDYTPALNNNLNVDDTGNTFAVLNGRYKVYIDPYAANNTAKQYFVVVTSTSPYDAYFLLPICTSTNAGRKSRYFPTKN